MAYWPWLPYPAAESNSSLRTGPLPALRFSRCEYGSRPSIHWTIANAACFSFQFFLPRSKIWMCYCKWPAFLAILPVSFCQYATCNMKPPDRYLSTFDLPGIYISPMLLTLRLNALHQVGGKSNRAIAATRKVPRPRVPALCLGKLRGFQPSFLYYSNPAEATWYHPMNFFPPCFLSTSRVFLYVLLLGGLAENSKH